MAAQDSNELSELNRGSWAGAGISPRLLAAVVHELQVVIQGLMVEADGLLREASKQNPDIKTISARASDIFSSVSMLREVANNLQTGPAPVSIRPFNAAETVYEMADLFRQKLGGRLLEIQVQVSDAPVMVKASEPLLRQVLYNLIDNAIKYSLQTATRAAYIKLGLRRQGDMMEVVVENVGSPISEAEIDRIFERGYRGKAAMQGGPLGFGLGLFVSLKILKEQGGDLKIVSLPAGEGDRALTRAIAKLPITGTPQAHNQRIESDG